MSKEELRLCQIQIHTNIRPVQVREFVVVLELTCAALAIRSRLNRVIVQRSVPCGMVRQNNRHDRILSRIISKVRNNIQAGIRFPWQGLSAIQFIFTINGTCIHRHREMVRSLPFERTRSTRNPSIVHRSHIVIIGEGFRQRQKRIEVETSKAGELSHEILGAITEAHLERHARFQAPSQIAVVKVMFPVRTVSGIAKESPVCRIRFGQIAFHIKRNRRQSLVSMRIGNGA